MVNSFLVRERVFIAKLTEDLLENEAKTGEKKGEEDEWEDLGEVEDRESKAVVDQALKKYEKAPVEAFHVDRLERGYDKGKLATIQLKWVMACQWVNLRYNIGVTSWGWFYNAPRISVFGESIKSLQLGVPFNRFWVCCRLLAWAVFRSLIRISCMIQTHQILDFYPFGREEDPNGNKQDWEAIVKFIFIEDWLLRAMIARDHRLTLE